PWSTPSRARTAIASGSLGHAMRPFTVYRPGSARSRGRPSRSVTARGVPADALPPVVATVTSVGHTSRPPGRITFAGAKTSTSIAKRAPVAFASIARLVVHWQGRIFGSDESGGQA